MQLFFQLLLVSAYFTELHAIIDNCDCRDWYGRCKADGEIWVDDETWSYQCSKNDAQESKFLGCVGSEKALNRVVEANRNETINGFWFSCNENKLRLKYDEEQRCTLTNGTSLHVGEEFRDNFFSWICLETGRWVTGCYYQNETRDWVKLSIGETAYNGLVKHVCDRFDDYPGRVQYYAQIRDDIPFKNPPNKGRSNNLPEPLDNRLKETPVRWLHENVKHFIENDNGLRSKIRYLEGSRIVS